MSDFRLYDTNNTTVLPTPQPRGSTWDQPERGTRPNGVVVRSLFAAVAWVYATDARRGPGLTDTEIGQLLSARREGQTQRIRTWRKALTGVAAGWVDCDAVIADIHEGRQRDDGRWYGVVVTFARVKAV